MEEGQGFTIRCENAFEQSAWPLKWTSELANYFREAGSTETYTVTMKIILPRWYMVYRGISLWCKCNVGPHHQWWDDDPQSYPAWPQQACQSQQHPPHLLQSTTYFIHKFRKKDMNSIILSVEGHTQQNNVLTTVHVSLCRACMHASPMVTTN